MLKIKKSETLNIKKMENLEFQPIQAAEQTPPQEATPPTPPKKRGRPRKEEKPPVMETPKEPEQETKKEKSASDLFEEMKRDIDQNAKGLEPEPDKENPIRNAARNIIDGYMLLTICDAFFPFILKMFFKKAKNIPDKEIRLSKDQKEHMQPIADEIAQGFLSFLDPVTLFFILQGAMYKQNLDDALQRREFSKK